MINMPSHELLPYIRFAIEADIPCWMELTRMSTTTYREGDKADTGHRETLTELGFAEAELLIEFGYPTQKFISPKGEIHINE